MALVKYRIPSQWPESVIAGGRPYFADASGCITVDQGSAEAADIIAQGGVEVTSDGGSGGPVNPYDSPVYAYMTLAQIEDVRNGTAAIDVTAALQSAINALPLNTASVGILTPKGIANGGALTLPRGR